MPRVKGQVARTFSRRMRREFVRGYDRAVRSKKGTKFLEKHKLGASHISNWRKQLKPAAAAKPKSTSPTTATAIKSKGPASPRPPVVDVDRVKMTAAAALRYHETQASRLRNMVKVLNSPVI